LDCRLRIQFRHIETFGRKKDAEAREAEVTVNVGKGVHIAASKTPTVREAGKLWLHACAHLARATVAEYEQHLRLHIEPYLGQYRLAHLTPPAIRQFEDDLRAGKPAPMLQVLDDTRNKSSQFDLDQ
jgi:hypothetical protein